MLSAQRQRLSGSMPDLVGGPGRALAGGESLACAWEGKGATKHLCHSDPLCGVWQGREAALNLHSW